MACPLHATYECGAAATSDALSLTPSFNSLTSDSALQDHNYNIHDPDLNEYLSLLVGADDLNLGTDHLFSDQILSHGSGAPPPMPSSLSSAPPCPSYLSSALAPESGNFDLQPQAIMRPAALCSSSISTPPMLQESAICCHLRPQVYQRQPSLTLFAPPPPPPSKVVQCLRSPHPHVANSLNALHRHLNADFAFHLDPINVDGSDGLPRNTIKAPASDYMPPLASAVDGLNDRNATLHLVAQGPKLIEIPHGAQFLPSDQCIVHPAPISDVGYNRAFSDSAVMEFSSASASSLSAYKTSMPDLEHDYLSAPVSPSPSVNKGAPSESFHNLEDFSFVHGGNGIDASMKKTEFYKLNDKFAWRKHGLGVIKKKKKYSRRTSPSIPRRTSIGDNVNHAYGHLEEINSTIEESGVLIRVKTFTLSLHDGYEWRKYGEKVIKNEKYTRNYLKCVEHKRTKCPVQKQTQRSSEDEDYVEFFYVGRHNHLP